MFVFEELLSKLEPILVENTKYIYCLLLFIQLFHACLEIDQKQKNSYIHEYVIDILYKKYAVNL